MNQWVISFRRARWGLNCFVLSLRAETNDWAATLGKARGQTVYWNAWAGDALINSYIDWAAREVKQRFGLDVRHVKLGDTAEALTPKTSPKITHAVRVKCSRAT